MAPVVHALRRYERLDTRVVVTAQHRGLLDAALHANGLKADVDLDLMRVGQPLEALAARILDRLGALLAALRPDRLLVHGDTVTAAAAALAGYYHRIPIGHVEAGLRSGDLQAPWPEEGNRKLIAALCDLHFAPTATAADALRREGVAPGTIHVTGNTGIDALLAMRDRLAVDPALAARLDPLAARFRNRRLVAITVHRRESFGPPLAGIAAAVARIADRPDTGVILPLHPNPHVAAGLSATLQDHPSIALVPPLDYPHFVRLMQMSDLILTDSGGVQEEAPSLGTPVIVLRDTTERPEGIAAGTAILAGTDEDAIVRLACALLDDGRARRAMARAHNPYGDGRAAGRIAAIIDRLHG